MDVDVVPVIERAGDLACGPGVGGLEVGERLVAEHDPPAERVAGTVALDDADFARRIRPLREERKVQSRRTAADAEDAHPFASRWAAPARQFASSLNSFGLK
jgi:hypothetical protein